MNHPALVHKIDRIDNLGSIPSRRIDIERPVLIDK